MKWVRFSLLPNRVPSRDRKKEKLSEGPSGAGGLSGVGGPSGVEKVSGTKVGMVVGGDVGQVKSKSLSVSWEVRVRNLGGVPVVEVMVSLIHFWYWDTRV